MPHIAEENNRIFSPKFCFFTKKSQLSHKKSNLSPPPQTVIKNTVFEKLWDIGAFFFNLSSFLLKDFPGGGTIIECKKIFSSGIMQIAVRCFCRCSVISSVAVWENRLRPALTTPGCICILPLFFPSCSIKIKPSAADCGRAFFFAVLTKHATNGIFYQRR